MKRTPEQLRQWLTELRVRCTRATKGPWKWDKIAYIFSDYGDMVADIPDDISAILRARGSGASLPVDENMEFVAHAREDIPDLLEYIDKLRHEIKFLRSWQVSDEGQQIMLNVYEERLDEKDDPFLSDAVQDMKQLMQEKDELKQKIEELYDLEFQNEKLREANSFLIEISRRHLRARENVESELKNFATDLMSKQKDLPPDIAKLIYDNLWNLYEEVEDGSPAFESIREGLEDAIEGRVKMTIVKTAKTEDTE